MELRSLVEQTIDAVIRRCDPEDPRSYDRWDRELERVERLLRGSSPELDQLLPSITAERIRIAFESGRAEQVRDRTADFLREFPTTVPSFSYIVSVRIKALHALGAHDEEMQEMRQFAMEPTLCNSEFVYLLANTARLHPGQLPADEDLWQKLQESIDTLRTQGYEKLSWREGGPEQLEEAACRVAEELRRANREQEKALLSGLL